MSKEPNQLVENSFTENLGERDLKFPTMQLDSIGSTGTDITAGIINEEYLNTLIGVDAADIYDKMRRSDAKVKMCLQAVANPIKGATWDIEPAGDDPLQIKQAELVKRCLFESLDKRWTSLLHEILTMTAFGYSLFERTHKLVRDDPDFGTYIGYKSISFRSQRTIENWNIFTEGPDKGCLKSVTQFAFGDAQNSGESMDAKYLTLFTLDREGSNFEGVSLLRPCYGPWLRKSCYLKLQAIGIEKYAVPTPILKIPDALQNKEQTQAAINALKKYVSHQNQYLTVPKGWEITLESNAFDPSKVQTTIDAENAEIVNAFLANFLLLGQGGSGGSYALSFDQSDFFLGGIEHIANLICEEFNDQIIPELINLNFGPQNKYPKMTCSGISDRIGQEYGDLLSKLAQTSYITPDDKLEDHLRERLKLPKRSDEGQRAQPEPSGGDFNLAEKKNAQNVELGETARGQIINGSKSIQAVLQGNVEEIGRDYIAQIMAKFKKLNRANQIDAIRNVRFRGTNDFKTELRDEIKKVAADASKRAQFDAGEKLEAPVRLAEREVEKEFNRLPIETQKKVISQSDQVAEGILDDVKRDMKLTYSSAIEDIQDPDQIEQKMNEKLQAVIAGTVLLLGAKNTASMVVNTTRNGIFFLSDIKDSIVGFRFSNVAPVTAICKDLTGRKFSIEDAESKRFRPPLHHNAIITGSKITTTKGDIPIEDVKIGDIVLTHKGNWKPVTKFMDRFEDKHYFEMILESGECINITGEHPVLTDKGWKRIDDLSINDEIVTLKDIKNKVSSI